MFLETFVFGYHDRNAFVIPESYLAMEIKCATFGDKKPVQTFFSTTVIFVEISNVADKYLK